jgi:hypothetical protein
MYNPYYRPGDNLYTNSLISWDPDSGKMNWYHQYTPGDMWDYDAANSHILIDGQVAGAPHMRAGKSPDEGREILPPGIGLTGPMSPMPCGSSGGAGVATGGFYAVTA